MSSGGGARLRPALRGASHRQGRVTAPATGIWLLTLGGAVILGALAPTGIGKKLIAGLCGLGLLCGFVALHRRSPKAALAVVWLLQVFQGPLAAAVGYNSSEGHAVREATDLLVVVLLLMSAGTRATPVGYRRRAGLVIGWVLVGVSLSGWASDLLHTVPLHVAVLGWWLAVKIWLVALIALRMPWERDDIERMYKLLMWVGVVVSVLAIIDYLGHGIVASTLGTNVNSSVSAGTYRANSVRAIFTTPNECSYFLSIVVAVALASYAERKRRSDLFYFLLTALAVLLTLRLKGVLSLGAVVAVVLLLKSRERRLNGLTILCIAVFAAVVVVSIEGNVVTRQVTAYTGANLETTARGQLYKRGFQIGAEDFPLGVGFGRYGSDTAREHYSPLYYKFGFSGIYGLSPLYPQFLEDTSWPAVIGESGYLGAAFVFIGFVWLAWMAIVLTRRGRSGTQWWGVAALGVVAATVIGSLGGDQLFDWLAALTIGAMYGPMTIADGYDDAPPPSDLTSEDGIIGRVDAMLPVANHGAGMASLALPQGRSNAATLGSKK